MNASNGITFRTLESLAAASRTGHSKALEHVVAMSIKTMSIYRIIELRCTIAAGLDPDLPSVAAALDMIDGQIALREIAGDAPWR